jgi:hypothetical protein
MANGLAMRRINRPNTWLHRPAKRISESPCQTGATHTWPITDSMGSGSASSASEGEADAHRSRQEATELMSSGA